MKIVCPFVGLEPATKTALDFSGYPAEYHWVGQDVLSYARTLNRIWAAQQDVILCEHDMLPTPEILKAMTECDKPFCSGAHAWTTNVGPAMGLVKWTGEFMAAYPDAAKNVAAVQWRQLDVLFMRTTLAKQYGEFPHVHLPVVEHLNPAQQLISPYDTWSVEAHLNNLGWWLDGEDGLTASYRGGVYGN